MSGAPASETQAAAPAGAGDAALIPASFSEEALDARGARDSAVARGLIDDGPFERCLEPLLEEAGWRGDVRQIIEALPHLERLQSVNDVRLVLHRLGYRSSIDLLRVEEIIDERLPALWMDGETPVVVLAALPSGRFLIYDSAADMERELTPPGRRMRLCRIHSQLDGEGEAAQAEADQEWLKSAVVSLGGEANFAALVTLFANILALAPPLFTMAVYNVILPADAVSTLGYIVLMALGAIGAETLLRRTRSRVLSTSAARLNCAIITRSFERILRLPTAMVENASVTAQTGRIKQFESIVGAFSGPVLGAIFDLPFVLVFLLAVGLLGGPLVFAPLTAIVLFVLLGAVLGPASDRAARRAALLKDRASSLTFEMLTNLESIHDLGAEGVWRGRVGEAQRRAVGARTRAAFLDYLRSSSSMFLISLSMIVSVCGGAVMVMNGDLSIGALVAISMLGARVLGPVHTLFMATQHIGGAREAARRFEALLRLKSVRSEEKAPAAFRPFKGAISFREIAFRFPNADEFALRGLSAEIKAGEIIGLVGAGGSGKSTVLKMLFGHYRPVSGQLFIDGANMTQIHPAELRAAVAYATPEPDFFYGTVAQNMSLGRPTATRDEIEEVFDDLGVVLDEQLFPKGLETRMGAQDYAGLSASLRQRLSIARALLKNAPITLLDEPEAMLTAEQQKQMFKALQRRRGKSTVLVSIGQPNLIRFCDRVMVMTGGKLARFAPPEAFRVKPPAGKPGAKPPTPAGKAPQPPSA